MIDFNNATFKKMKKTEEDTYNDILLGLLADDERVIGVYKAMRDGVVFTDRRIIAINIQGMTGKKKDFTSLPYEKIQVFSIETSGVLDIDSELELWYSSVGRIRFEFTGNCDMGEISRAIADHLKL